MDLHFTARGKHFIAVDSQWMKNGYRVYDILDDSESCVDTVMVHPLDSIENAVDEWAKNYRGSISSFNRSIAL
jgi:hypothetical protein